MKTTLKTLLLILSISLVSCKEEKLPPTPPDITTLEATEITATSAVCGGEMDDYRNDLAIGIEWSINPQNTENGNLLYALETWEFVAPVLPGKRFICEMTGLTPNTKYYVFAWVSNYMGYRFGQVIEFTTLAE